MNKKRQNFAEDKALFDAITAGHIKPDIEPSIHMTQRIMAAVAVENVHKKRFSFIATLSSGIAAAIVLTFCLQAVSVYHSSAKDASVTENRDSITSNNGITILDSAADWLAAQQQPDGSWSPAQTGGNEAFRPALTALSLMALLRHAPVRHAVAINRAVAALEAMQLADGSFSAQQSSKLYNHAFVSYALIELGNARGVAISPVINRAIAFSLKNQNHFGAWDYTKDEPGNTALTVWQLGLLIRARQAGWSDSTGNLRRGLAWLRRQSRDGAFDYRETIDRHYQPHTGSITLTAMATATLLDAADAFPELHATADTAVAALRIAFNRAEAKNDHYRDYFLCRIYRSNEDASSEKKIVARIASQHSQKTSRVSAPWIANDVWATTGGDLYATVMAMLSVNRVS